MFKIVMLLAILISPCAAMVSSSVSIYNDNEQISMSSNMENGQAIICASMGLNPSMKAESFGMTQGGHCSMSEEYGLSTVWSYSVLMASNGRDTYWDVSLKDYGINTNIESKGY